MITEADKAISRKIAMMQKKLDDNIQKLLDSHMKKYYASSSEHWASCKRASLVVESWSPHKRRATYSQGDLL